MNPEHINAMTIILAFAGYEIIRQLIAMGMKKLRGDEYVTRSYCKTCVGFKKIDEDNLKEFKKEMREKIGAVIGILLLLASNGKIEPTELAKLLVQGKD